MIPHPSEPGWTPSSPGMTADRIEERLAWARREGHAAWLWPDISVPAWRACLREIERVTSLILAGREPPALEPPPGADARTLGIAAFTSGMGPLLGWWIERGTLQAADEVAFRMRSHLAHGRERAERLARALRNALDLLASEGVGAVVLKGAHTGRACFPEPGTRPAADIDIAIAPADIARTERTLDRAGYERIKTRRRPWKCDWRPPGAPHRLHSIELTHAENPFTLEVHEGLDRIFFGVRRVSFGPPEAWHTERAPDIHPGARVLRQPLLTAFLAAHASEELHQLQIVRLVELAFVLRSDAAAGSLDWNALDALLERLDAHRFVQPALELTEQLAPGALDPRLRERLSGAASPRMRRVLGRLSPGTAQRLHGLSLEETFFWADGPAETMKRLAHLLWPTRGESESLHSVYMRRLASLLRGRVRLRRP